ncbi:hypothetical protein BXZ70DRAFT_1064452 [Cristinia sonorae]|uniref:Uncharacterized protein n=1 Tax=Cristinia sonorae TaxID=1940300 RepID=A0A8K0XQ66_9AGAR|nr:hypothetical protein BXZ70DRAFT_1064452 [Cristinia sonorae]
MTAQTTPSKIIMSSDASLIDDIDTSILYSGSWTHINVFDASSGSNKTISYTEEAGSIDFDFGPTDVSTSVQLIVYGYKNTTSPPSTSTYTLDSEPLVSHTPYVDGSTIFFISKPLSSSDQHRLRINIVKPPYALDSFAVLPSGSISSVPPPPVPVFHVGAVVGALFGGIGITLACLAAVWFWRKRFGGFKLGLGRKGPILTGAQHVPPTAALRDTHSIIVEGDLDHHNLGSRITPYTLQYPSTVLLVPSPPSIPSTPHDKATHFPSNDPTPWQERDDPFASPSIGTTPMSSTDVLSTRTSTFDLTRHSTLNSELSKLSASSGGSRSDISLPRPLPSIPAEVINYQPDPSGSGCSTPLAPSFPRPPFAETDCDSHQSVRRPFVNADNASIKSIPVVKNQ